MARKRFPVLDLYEISKTTNEPSIAARNLEKNLLNRRLQNQSP